MKNFLKEHGLWILFAGAVIAVALAALSFFSATSSPLVDVTKTLTAPFRSAYTAIATWFNDKQDYYRSTKALEEENAALRQEIARMEEAIRQAELDSEENQRLRELLGLREQRRDLVWEAALVTEREVSNWTSSLSLNKGTLHGVENGDCVIDETGALVGVVRETGTNWCTVLTLVDIDTSLGAQVFRTKDLALAVGNFSLMEKNRLRLEYLPVGAQLLRGDVVQTSGLRGFYPSGLVIGTVEEVQIDESGAASYAVLAPSADLDALTEVFIIKDFDIVT